MWVRGACRAWGGVDRSIDDNPIQPHTQPNTADGDENWHLFKVDVTAEQPTARDLTPFEGVRAQGVMTARSRPDELLVRPGG